MTERLNTYPDPHFDHVERLLRDLSVEDTDLVQPPEDLWDRINADLDQAAVNGTASRRNVVALASRRKFSPKTAILGAAAALVLLLGGLVLVVQRDDATAVVADAELVYDPISFDKLGASAEAHVVLVNNDDTYRVKIERSNLPDVASKSEDLEIWLIEPDADGQPVQLVSLGRIDPNKPTTFVVPAAYDPKVFSVVDISVEPRDGDANHSGRSILRGALTTT